MIEFSWKDPQTMKTKYTNSNFSGITLRVGLVLNSKIDKLHLQHHCFLIAHGEQMSKTICINSKSLECHMGKHAWQATNTEGGRELVERGEGTGGTEGWVRRV